MILDLCLVTLTIVGALTVLSHAVWFFGGLLGRREHRLTVEDEARRRACDPRRAAVPGEVHS